MIFYKQCGNHLFLQFLSILIIMKSANRQNTLRRKTPHDFSSTFPLSAIISTFQNVKKWWHATRTSPISGWDPHPFEISGGWFGCVRSYLTPRYEFFIQLAAVRQVARYFLFRLAQLDFLPDLWARGRRTFLLFFFHRDCAEVNKYRAGNSVIIG